MRISDGSSDVCSSDLLWEKALAYYRDLGARAMSRSANAEAEAVAAFERALTALDALPGTADFLEQSIDVKLDAASALFGLGEQDRALARIQEAQDLAQKLDDQPRPARVFSAMTLSYWRSEGGRVGTGGGRPCSLRVG